MKINSLRTLLLPKIIGGFVILLLTAAYSTRASTISAEEHYRMALEFDAGGKYKSAMQQLDLTLLKSPEMWEAVLARGAVYLKQERFEDAEKELLRVVFSLPGSNNAGDGYYSKLSMALNNLGVVEHYRAAQALLMNNYDSAANHWDIAWSHFSRALRIDPTNAEAYRNLQRPRDLRTLITIPD